MNRLLDVVVDVAIGYVVIKIGTKLIRTYGDLREIIGIVEGIAATTIYVAEKGEEDDERKINS